MKTKELTELGKWKVGQEILVTTNLSEHIDKITKITSGRDGTIYVGNSKYYASNGWAIGADSFSRCRISVATEEDRLRIRSAYFCYRLSKMPWEKLTREQLFSIVNTIKGMGINIHNPFPVTTTTTTPASPSTES